MKTNTSPISFIIQQNNSSFDMTCNRAPRMSPISNDRTIILPETTTNCNVESRSASARPSQLRGETKVVRWNNDTTNIRNDTMRENNMDMIRVTSNLARSSIAPDNDESNVSKPQRHLSEGNREERIAFALTVTKWNPSDDSSSLTYKEEKKTENNKDDQLTRLSSQMAMLETKIQNAACDELRTLQLLDEVTQKRRRWEKKLHEAESRRVQATEQGALAKEFLESYISEAQTKIVKAMNIEKVYKRKVKQLHDRRYRWSKLYENAGRDLLELDPTSVISSLPPLLSSSFYYKY